MAGRAFLAKLGLATGITGTLASLGLALGTDTDAANRIGLYSDVTPAAEKLGLVVGGTEIASFNADLSVGLDTIQFSLTPSGPTGEGAMNWSAQDGTVEVGMPGGVVMLQVGQEHLLRATATGSNIDNGQLAYISGGAGDFPDVTLGSASSIATASVIGMATEDITVNQKGFLTTRGKVRYVDTLAYAPGTTLWLDTVLGDYTSTRPTQPNVGVSIGQVVRQHATEGIIYADINIIPNLVDLSDVLISGPSDGAVVAWDNASSTWQATSDPVFSSLTINGKLTVTGLIDPTGLELTPVAANPGGTAANTVWLDSGNGNRWSFSNTIDIAGQGITNAGAIAGATTISATGVISTTDTIAATSSAGSIRTAGGISAAGGGYFGGNVTISTASGSYFATTTTGTPQSFLWGSNADYAFIYDNTTPADLLRIAKNSGNITAFGTLTVTDTTDSSSTSTGALVVAGGVGIAKSVFIGGTGSATSPYGTGAALDVAGGIAAIGNSYFGDAINANGDNTHPTVGIGQVESAYNTAESRTGLYSQLSLALTGNNSNSHRGIYSRAFYNPGGNSFTGTCIGTHSVTYATGTSGTISALHGMYSACFFAGTGGTISNAYGVYSILQSTSVGQTVTNAYNFYGVDTNLEGVANRYGIYLGNIEAGSSLNYAIYTNAGLVRIGDTTTATSTTTGALVVDGGVGIAKKLYVGGSTTIANGAISKWTWRLDASNNLELYNETSTQVPFEIEATDAIKIAATLSSTGVANSTTASAANVYIDPATGLMQRSTSSRRYKDEIRYDIDPEIAFNLKPASYDSIVDNTNDRFVGFIAEDVAEVDPRLVVFDSKGKPDALHYGQFTAVNTAAIQVLASRTQSLASRTQSLETRMATTEAALAKLGQSTPSRPTQPSKPPRQVPSIAADTDVIWARLNRRLGDFEAHKGALETATALKDKVAELETQVAILRSKVRTLERGA